MPSGLRINLERSLLEFDAVVAIDCHNPVTPDVYLELVACSPDTREHESLVVTEVPASLIHAGLLAIGFTPGSPGRVGFKDGVLVRTPATGDRLNVAFVYEADGKTFIEPASSWIVDVASRTGHPRNPRNPQHPQHPQRPHRTDGSSQARGSSSVTDDMSMTRRAPEL